MTPEIQQNLVAFLQRACRAGHFLFDNLYKKLEINYLLLAQLISLFKDPSVAKGWTTCHFHIGNYFNLYFFIVYFTYYFFIKEFPVWILQVTCIHFLAKERGESEYSNVFSLSSSHFKLINKLITKKDEPWISSTLSSLPFFLVQDMTLGILFPFIVLFLFISFLFLLITTIEWKWRRFDTQACARHNNNISHKRVIMVQKIKTAFSKYSLLSYPPFLYFLFSPPFLSSYFLSHFLFF